jgi:hypothetical protein
MLRSEVYRKWPRSIPNGVSYLYFFQVVQKFATTDRSAFLTKKKKKKKQNRNAIKFC